MAPDAAPHDAMQGDYGNISELLLAVADGNDVVFMAGATDGDLLVEDGGTEGDTYRAAAMGLMSDSIDPESFILSLVDMSAMALDSDALPAIPPVLAIRHWLESFEVCSAVRPEFGRDHLEGRGGGSGSDSSTRASKSSFPMALCSSALRCVGGTGCG